MFNDISMGIGPFTWADGQLLDPDSSALEVHKLRFERNPDYFIP